MNSLTEISFVTRRDRAETLAAALRAAGAPEPAILIRPLCDTALVCVYETAPANAKKWLAPAFASQALAARARQMAAGEWTGFWKHHFRVQDIGERFRVVPVWEKCPDRKRINLRLDPGLSFGTGNHFTTRFCLEALESAFAAFPVRRVLDAGAGSGILSLAAWKLGARQIRAFDLDPACVREFPRACRLNRVPVAAIRFREENVLSFRPAAAPYDVVLANILSHLLIAAAPRLWAATGRRLILSGVREEEADGVADAYRALGAEETARDGDGQWCGIVLERRQAK